MPDRPFMEELLGRLRSRHGAASFTAAGDGLTWQDEHAGTVTLITSEEQLADAIRQTGTEVRDDLWPGSTVEEAGFDLLLIHLDEVLATRDVAEPLRLTREGLVWPNSRTSAFDGTAPDAGYHWSSERGTDT